ncbi:MAG: 5-dehydro-4-deoxy-D-glucuronate isomerase [Phycisphaerae bacterium]|nr:5-dehydro-4-deoxy-D-glucuronate isomerase [Phycisphaerae bacterium]
MDVRYLPDPIRFCRMTTEEVRGHFLVKGLFEPGKVFMVYCDADRAIVGSAVPTKARLTLSAADELRAATFCERRELGVLNIGAHGTVTVDGKKYAMANRDCLYVGRGAKEVEFASDDSRQPARFYLLSYPAHAEHPTVHLKKSQAEPVHTGSPEQANERTIYKYIHPAGAQSCQLVMGFTELAPGSVWNTMPPHTHARRMEVYLYFDMPKDGRVFHLMGRPDETRHIVVADGEVVLSPSWSIHSGVGTCAYTFCWGMGGENQAFDDMDGLSIGDLK